MADLENTIHLDLEAGRVVIELKPDVAPGHVARIKELAREGFSTWRNSRKRVSSPDDSPALTVNT